MTEPVALVTGATGGVGASLCERLATSYTVVAVGRDEEKLARLANRTGVKPVRGDLTDPEFRQHLSNEVPQCKVIVHSAGISVRKPHDQVTLEDLNETFLINFFAVQQLTALFIERLREANGDIIMLNSGAGQFSSPGNSLYSAAKHALRAYSNSLREEEREHGVRVVSVFPGYIDTEMAQRIARETPGSDAAAKMIAPATVANAVMVALAAPHEATYEELTIRPTVPVILR